MGSSTSVNSLKWSQTEEVLLEPLALVFLFLFGGRGGSAASIL
jgi:hypothetical protein